MAERNVLIVHEDMKLIDGLKQALAASGADVVVTSVLSGPRALGIIEAQRPAVIVVDAELEGMDGYALTQQIKKGAGGEVPVMIVSLQPGEASALRARQAGAAAHLSSSGPVEAIASKILAMLGVGAVSEAPAVVPPTVTEEALTPGVAAPMGVSQAVTEPASVQSPTGVSPSMNAGPGVPQQVSPQPSQPVSPQPVSVPQPAPPVAFGSGVPQPIEPSQSSAVPEPRVVAEVPTPTSDVPHVDDLLRLMLERGGSDLHITVGSPPGIRQRGEIVQVENQRPLTQRDVQVMVMGLLSEEQRRRFETELELDFAYSIPGVSRFRANVFQQRNSLGAVFRVIPIEIPTLEQLHLPKVCKFLAERPRGLVLVTGPTGSGKSTTLAAMINHINATRPLHIITMEDPIEFMHKNQKAYVNQREVGEDTHSFASALKRVLRQDPDVILVGEMRDLETISAAITAAETGHLVLATLHTTGGPETIDRIIDVFPPHQQQQVRMQLSNTLEGVLSQVLLRSTDGRSRMLAMEIMLGIPAIRNLIREGKTHQ
ncbi:MAG: PilT/PilU family type 4a pilus ATPase, partial [Coriobacteriia bacterium]|nr:PilT/PilU family type 4a pilus ATPase [Coriobacteriia bacterium]